MPARPVNKNRLLLFAIVITIVAVMLLTDPLAQDPAYHVFADQLPWFGIPHFRNVVSNLPYILVGLFGLARILRQPVPGGLPELRLHYGVFFAGVCLVGFGSGWYHLQPTNESLVWDRLAMTIAFMAFFAAIIGEYYSVAAGRKLLWPLLLAGIFSVLYWHLGEQAGRGDLRPYAIVQFLPMLLLPVIVLTQPARLQPSTYLWALMACYLLAKVFEFYDREVYQLTGVLSGHTLKHLVSAAGPVFFYLALLQRQRTTAT